MSAAEIFALLPLIVLSAASVVVMMAIGFYRNHTLTAELTVTGLILAFLSLWAVANPAAVQITPLLIMDGYAPYFMGLIMAGGLAAVLLSHGYLDGQEGLKEEYYLLVLLVVLGASVVVASSHFASFFLGLELLTLSFYGLIAYMRTSSLGVEAGIKYLILSAVSDAFLLFGIALIYGETGFMEFGRIAEAAARGHSILLWTGTALLATGIGFKLSVVPFHMWTPDVYQGAPAPVTGLLATVSKVAVFALLVRYFNAANLLSSSSMATVFTLIAITSMIAGNALALLQNNVKRMLAYSSIAHMGYLLVAFLAGGKTGLTAVGYYLVAYAVTTMGAFGVITVISGNQRDADRMEDFQGLAWERPWLAGIFALMLLSLAGIPLTAGFVGKLYVMAAGVGSALWLLVITLIVTSVMGLFYYLRVIVVMFSTDPEQEKTGSVRFGSWADGLVLAVLTALLLWFGIYPSHLIGIIESTVIRLS